MARCITHLSGKVLALGLMRDRAREREREREKEREKKRERE
jgi:hypothetical protein